MLFGMSKEAKMTIEQRLNNLESRLDSLQESFIQSQRNNVEVTAKADVGYNKPDAPYTATQTAYIDDTEIVFEGVKEGNLSVYVKDKDGNYPDYTVERAGERVTVHFEPLENETTVTISII